MNPRRKSPFLRNLLLILIVVTSILMALVGIVMKYLVCRPAGVLQDTFSMAVPFILIQDSKMREDVFGPSGKTDVAESESSSEAASDAADSTDETVESASDDADANASAGELVPGMLQPVDEDYWDGVLFIGDSRTDGLKMYAPFEKADYFSGSSFTSYDILEDSTTVSIDGANYTLKQLLSERTYHAVYIMLGINEIGHSLDGIQAKLTTLMDTVRQYQPQAYLVMQANLKCTRAVEERNSELTQPLINNLNAMIASLADNETIFYIDVNPLFCDDEGYLKDDLTKDGAHPYAANYAAWKDFLSQNGVVKKQ